MERLKTQLQILILKVLYLDIPLGHLWKTRTHCYDPTGPFTEELQLFLPVRRTAKLATVNLIKWVAIPS